jgi:preprotein translocase SecE subunit
MFAQLGFSEPSPLTPSSRLAGQGFRAWENPAFRLGTTSKKQYIRGTIMRQEQTNQKWVYLIFIGFSTLSWYLFAKVFEYAIDSFNLQRKIRNIFIYSQVVSVLLGMGTFWILVQYEKFWKYIQDVVSETLKVNWPNKREVIATTTVVIIGVLIAGVVLGMFDHFFSILMRWVLNS